MRRGRKGREKVCSREKRKREKRKEKCVRSEVGDEKGTSKAKFSP
jgi:hypothetical protein